MQALILAGLLVTVPKQVPTEVPLPPPPTYKVALESKVTIMLEQVRPKRPHVRSEAGRRLDEITDALERQPLTGRHIQSPSD